MHPCFNPCKNLSKHNNMKKVLLSMAVLLGLTSATHAQTLSDSLKGCFTFNGTDSFKDGTSTGILVSYNGIHSRTSDRFNGNNALAFTGVGYVSAGNAAKFSVMNGLTISAWIYIDPLLTGEGAVVSKWDNSTGDEYLFGVYSNNKLALAIQGKVIENTMLSRTVLADTTWYHVAMTWAKGGMTGIYINGVLDTGSILVDSLVNTSTPFNIGGQGSGLSRYFQGKIDDVRMYNRALSGTEISTLYANDSACGLKYTPPPSGVQNINIAQGIKVFPNPATDAVTIAVANKANVLVCDVNGRVVYNAVIDKKAVIDISGYSKGIYIIRATDGDGNRYVSRFIKE